MVVKLTVFCVLNLCLILIFAHVWSDSNNHMWSIDVQYAHGVSSIQLNSKELYWHEKTNVYIAKASVTIQYGVADSDDATSHGAAPGVSDTDSDDATAPGVSNYVIATIMTIMILMSVMMERIAASLTMTTVQRTASLTIQRTASLTTVQRTVSLTTVQRTASLTTARRL